MGCQICAPPSSNGARRIHLKARTKETRPADEDEESLELDGIDLPGAKVPRRWQVSSTHGVRRAFAAKDSDTEIIACPDPVVISRRLTAIPAKHQLPIHAMSPAERRKAAGYARVSTNEEEQQTSYEAQVDYYTKMIQGNPEWEYVGVYTDEGISATSTKKRDGFNQMVEDALAGKIQLIITKSVSRFARNTVDSLSTIRKLKEAGVEVWFEKEAIKTFDSKGELLITIMSSLAQEESFYGGALEALFSPPFSQPTAHF